MDCIFKKTIASVLSMLVAGTTAAASDQNTVSSPNAQPSMEKCYGIVKAGMNDCQTSDQSCAGSAVKNNQSDAFILLPKGICDKIVGGKKNAGKLS